MLAIFCQDNIMNPFSRRDCKQAVNNRLDNWRRDPGHIESEFVPMRTITISKHKCEAGKTTTVATYQ